MNNRKHATAFILWILLMLSITAAAQNYPWKSPLIMAWSADGITFGTPTVFQDSSGVPSVVRWKGDTLICAFQWFRAPVNSPTWDRVAVKYSYDNGLTWTTPVPIVVNGLPANYQRPFDPTLAVFGGDSIRIYFSSSNGMPAAGLDSTINTYSAKSHDGVNYTFEPNPRVDQLSNRVIDPAVIHFATGWHYLAPIGSPAQGAYHYVSPDGLTFSQVPNIPSDNIHNWTGNYMVESATELRFYGCAPGPVWFNSTPNGGVWNGYVNTNIIGGDPSVVKVEENSYLMICVGPPYPATGIHEVTEEKARFVYPCPAGDRITVPVCFSGSRPYCILTSDGKLIGSGTTDQNFIDTDSLGAGVYLLILETGDKKTLFRFIKY